MFEGQPKGLFALALANTGERFGYYTMLAVFALFLRANYGLSPALAGTIYSAFLMLVYFFPLIGGIMADKFGFGRMVTTGIMIMFAGYLLLAVPLGGDNTALIVMLAALLLIGFGTGLFKGNLTRSSKEEIIAYALERCGNPDKKSVLMIGDRHYDIEGAHQNGIKACGVLYGYGKREELESASADYIAEKIPDILDI